jgi:predicted nucleic acid-binding protein
MIHLDTSFLIRALVPGSSEGVRLGRWLRGDLPVRMSSIAWTEFLCGPVEPEAARLAGRVVGESVPFATGDAELAASLFNQSGRRRGALNDCMIAATAIGAAAELATSDRVDFERFRSAGLVLAS